MTAAPQRRWLRKGGASNPAPTTISHKYWFKPSVEHLGLILLYYLECSKCLGRDPATERAAEIYTAGKTGKEAARPGGRTLSLVLARDHSFLSTLQRRSRKTLHWEVKGH